MLEKIEIVLQTIREDGNLPRGEYQSINGEVKGKNDEWTMIWMWISSSIKDTEIVANELGRRLLLNPKVHTNTSAEQGEPILKMTVAQIGKKYLSCGERTHCYS